jgi:hypothetical protein
MALAYVIGNMFKQYVHQLQAHLQPHLMRPHESFVFSIHLLRLTSPLLLMISIFKQRLFKIGRHLFLSWFIHRGFVLVAFRVRCMNFYKIVLS